MVRTTGSTVMAAVLFLLVGHAATLAQELDGLTVYQAPKTTGYRKSWALLIGINYTGRQEEVRRDPANQRALPELKNAANDARSLASVLTTYYQYDEDAVTLLTDDSDTNEAPTAARIREEINKLCNPQRVLPDDSVLIFFAGHGFKLDRESSLGGNAVSLLPYDVELSRGQPVGLNKIGVPDELFKIVSEIPAKHKLIVLDCCYSGEIFNARGMHAFQQRGDASNRSDRGLQEYPTFQAMSSCRATQVASDGRDGNSKFTTALLDGLKHIPARSDGDQRVWANRLLAYMQSGFDQFQRPECRDLIGSKGEFCFFPRELERFASFALHDDDKSHLKAMVVSRQGNWWFEEMPWFLPSIRAAIVRKHEESQTPTRSANFSRLIELDELRKAAEELFADEKGAAKTDDRANDLKQMRFEHARELMNAHDAKKLEAALTRIETELIQHIPETVVHSEIEPLRGTEPSDAAPGSADIQPLESEDLHFLAVVQHALGKRTEAETSYALALKAYDNEQVRDQDRLRPSLHILAALCRADFGEFLLQELREPRRAAEEFAKVQTEIHTLLKERPDRAEDSAAFFRIFMLCREADAWLAINRWSQANQLLAESLAISEALAPNHYLQAHVHRRRAWAQIIQWQIQAAKSSFQRSNEILYEHFRREARRRGDLTESLSQSPGAPSDQEQPDSADGRPAIPRATSGADGSGGRAPLGPLFRSSTDHASKIAYLHNLHGIAMATRFEGATNDAASFYRWLYGEVEDAFSRFRDSSSDADLERQFITRLINTQERLGDCNLFGNPDERDLGEALDDYRRALSHVHLLRGTERDRNRASLLYKQALALSLDSPVRDNALALQMCRRADSVYQAQREKATGLWQALGELTTATVECLYATSASPSAAELGASGCEATCELRTAIELFRDVIGTTPHRDQLELCLFASKVLLENGSGRDDYQVQADADLLLSFCRIGLEPYLIEQDYVINADDALEAESRAYLRPYYDAIMQAKLTRATPNIKELLEIQAEATRGTRYVKPETETPVIAMYALGSECYLLVNLPHGASNCVSLAEMYDVDTIRRSCDAPTLLRMPRNVDQSLVAWQSRQLNVRVAPIDLRWEDPVREFVAARRLDSPANESTSTAARPISGHFPFALPNGFLLDSTAATVVGE